MKGKSKRTTHSIEQRKTKEKHIAIVNTVAAHMSHRGAKPITVA